MISLIAFFALAQAPSPEVVQHVQAGIAADKQGQHEAAITEFRQATTLQPDFPAAYIDLATVYMEENKYAEAVPPLLRAIELAPQIEGAQEMLGDALLHQGYAAQAIPHFEAAGTKEGLGIAQLETGDLVNAVLNLQAARQLHPNDPDILFYLSRAAGLLSKQAGDILLSEDPGSARAHQALAESYWALQHFPDAQKEFMLALNIQPDLPGVHLSLGQLYEKTQQWQSAEQEFAAEAALRPGDPETAYRLGNALLENGKIQESERQLEHANTLQPDMPETLYALGRAASLAGDSARAETAWMRLLTIEDDTSLAAKAHFGLATLYRKQGKISSADAQMQAYLKLKSATK